MIDATLHLPASFLHKAFSDRSGVPLHLFELYYRGKRLEGEAVLVSWGICKGATIEVKMRGRGGAPTPVLALPEHSGNSGAHDANDALGDAFQRPGNRRIPSNEAVVLLEAAADAQQAASSAAANAASSGTSAGVAPPTVHWRRQEAVPAVDPTAEAADPTAEAAAAAEAATVRAQP